MPEVAVLMRDLRIADNPVLAGAGTDVVPLFVSDDSVHMSPNQKAYLHESLRDLDRSLRELGSSLVYRAGSFDTEVRKVVDEVRAGRVHIGRDADELSQRRVADLRASLGVPIIEHTSITVIDPHAVTPVSADYYQRFTPYHERWRTEERRPIHQLPSALRPHSVNGQPIPDPPTLGTSPQRRNGGERAARKRFDAWIDLARSYGDTRDELVDGSTSRVSEALSFGELSAVEVVDAALGHGADEFVRQVAWRDFNHQLLFHRPDLEHQGLRSDPIRWIVDDEALDAWREGRTGYPVVDAAMRQLTETGWMPNRARMITASFLTKHLLQDWRVGAEWFRAWLTDFDVANNQLGWQWVAGVGVDTNPWRMLNPTLQSRRHDPSGGYITTWVPELSAWWVDDVHDPSPESRTRSGYPPTIIDHREAVARYRDRKR